MRVINDWGLVRLVSTGDPFTLCKDLRVEVKEGESWRLWEGFNTLSDDWAHTNAREAAGWAIKEMARRVATEGL